MFLFLGILVLFQMWMKLGKAPGELGTAHCNQISLISSRNQIWNSKFLKTLKYRNSKTQTFVRPLSFHSFVPMCELAPSGQELCCRGPSAPNQKPAQGQLISGWGIQTEVWLCLL